MSTVLHHEELDEQELLEDEEEELTERFEFVQAALLSSWVEKWRENIKIQQPIRVLSSSRIKWSLNINK